MDYTFFCYPRCTTCQKAKVFLDERGITYTFRDIKEDNPSGEELTEWVKRGTYPLKTFFNTSGQKYRALGLKDRLPTLTEEEQIELLSSDGMLVKRPILVNDNVILVGFKREQWEEGLVQPNE